MAVAKRSDVHRFYFLDETDLDHTRRYARARGCRRISGAVPLQRGRAVTLIGALGVRGLKAVQLLDGALNQRSFAFYVARVLGPQLRRGDVLVLDNLPVHKLGGLQQELARRGVEVLFLPPYSPDFTPVEQAWRASKSVGQSFETPLRLAWMTFGGRRSDGPSCYCLAEVLFSGPTLFDAL